MKSALLRLFSALSFFALCSVGAAGDAGGGAGGAIEETYRYSAVPSPGGDSEEILVKFSFAGEGEYRSYNSTVRESIVARTDRDGFFIGGAKHSAASNSSVYVRRQGEHIIIENARKRRVRKIPEGLPVAADGSLLILFRRLIDRGAQATDVFMVDFTGVTVTAGIRFTGTERIEVPAGSFDCHRIEVSLRIPLLRPKVIFWLAKEQPHFMVKHQGKRGPFSRTYTTSLLEIAPPDGPGSSPVVEN